MNFAAIREIDIDLAGGCEVIAAETARIGTGRRLGYVGILYSLLILEGPPFHLLIESCITRNEISDFPMRGAFLRHEDLVILLKEDCIDLSPALRAERHDALGQALRRGV